MDLADRDGVAAVSMRRIAAELGVTAPSLYWHVRSKNELYELMADAVVGKVALPKHPSGDWRRDLCAIARATRETLRRHSWYAELGIQPMLGPQTQRYAQRATTTLRGLGLDTVEQVEILAALNNYIVGFVHREHAWHEVMRRSGQSRSGWSRELKRLIADTAASDPELAEQMTARTKLHGDASFEFGLACLVDGIATRVSTRDPAAPGAQDRPGHRSG